MVADLLLLPGLGADERLFQYQARRVARPYGHPSVAFPPRGRSRSPGSRSVSPRAFPTDRPRFVGGASFGGMVALELAALVRPEAVVLIGSCTTSESGSRHGCACLGVSAHACPRASSERVRGPHLSLLPMFGLPGRGERRLFSEMASAVEPGFLKWGCRAILSWRPAAYDGPVFHLHGSADRIIPLHRVRPSHVVKGAGHLLSLSHPVETTDFLSRILEEVRGLSQTKSSMSAPYEHFECSSCSYWRVPRSVPTPAPTSSSD